jgi:hypothetical protein
MGRYDGLSKVSRSTAYRSIPCMDPEGSSIIFWSYLPDIKDIVILTAFEDTAGNEAPSGFDKFMAIPDAIASTMRIASHKELTDELEQAVGYR